MADEVKTVAVEAKRAEAALYLFVESVQMLESNGWIRERNDTTNEWYWWRNPEVAQGMCSMSAALRYEHARQSRVKPVWLVGDPE